MKKMFILALVIAFAAACGGKKKNDTKPHMGSADGSATHMGSGDHHGSGDHGSGSAAPTP